MRWRWREDEDGLWLEDQEGQLLGQIDMHYVRPTSETLLLIQAAPQLLEALQVMLRQAQEALKLAKALENGD